jgi:hypothetical protein
LGPDQFPPGPEYRDGGGENAGQHEQGRRRGQVLQQHAREEDPHRHAEADQHHDRGDDAPALSVGCLPEDQDVHEHADRRHPEHREERQGRYPPRSEWQRHQADHGAGDEAHRDEQDSGPEPVQLLHQRRAGQAADGSGAEHQADHA